MNFIKQYTLDDISLCERLIDSFTVCNYRMLTDQGTVGPEKRIDPAIKQSTDLYLDDHILKAISPLRTQVESYMSQINRFIEDYIEEFSITKLCGRVYLKHPPQIQWYKPSEGFKQWHADGVEGSFDRAFVFLTYLNDVKDGGTEFLHQNHYEEAEQGKTIIFPSAFTHIHRGRISDTEHKYIMTGWIYWDLN